MYESYFRFTERPFAVLPDSSRIFWTEGHRNAFSVLEVGLDRLSQVSVLTGGIGTGKTTLIRHLLHTISGGLAVGLLSNFAGNRGDLLPWVLSSFGLNVSGSCEAIMFRRLETFCAAQRQIGRRSLLIVDEAQNLSEPDLEALRRLSNLNAEEVRMMLVLVGQPQLRARIARPENQRLCQRIGADYHLEAFSKTETARYVRHRCVHAGGSPSLFDDEALDEVHRICTGIPRKINVLCDLALVSAYADGAERVDCRVVRSLLEDARRHGTYMSLTEHDIVAVAETGIAVGAENQPLPVAAVKGPARDPVQRLTLVLESGSGHRRTGPAERVSSARETPAVSRAPASPPPSGPAETADLGALFDMTWSDDTLMFVSDPVEADPARAPSAERPAALPRDSAPEDDAGRAARDAAEPRRPAPSRRPTARDEDAQVRQALPALSDTIFQRPAPRPAAPAASTFPASGTERALRQAFTPQPAWRRIGRRGGTIVAFAAGGAMAAALAIALLPDWEPSGDPQASLTRPATEVRPASMEGSARRETPSVAADMGLHASAEPASLPTDATVAAPQEAAPHHPAAAPGEEPSVADDWARIAPLAMFGQSPESDAEAAAPVHSITSAPPHPAGTGARLAAVTGAPGKPPQQRAASRPEPLRGLHTPEGASMAVAALHGTAGDALAPHPTDLPLYSAAPTPPAQRTTEAAQAIGADRSAGGGSAGVLPRGEPSLPFLAKALRAPRTAPARPAAPGLPAADPAGPPIVELASARVAEARAETVAQATLPTRAPAVDPEAVFRDAVDIALEDSLAAVVGYARAALMGHERAAYYLGQIYETGDGVPVDLAIAHHWYEAASLGNPRAQRRLAALPGPEAGAMIAPLPVLAQLLDARHAEFVWTSGEGADPASYVVEVSSDPESGAVAAYPVIGSAARLALVEGATHWRVLAVDAAGGRSAPSDWRVVSPAGSDRSAAAETPPDHL